MNYAEIVSKAQKGELLIGIEPAVARKFFMDTNTKGLEIGQPMSVKISLINTILILDWLFMLFTDIVSIIAFKWWSIAIIPVILIAHMFYQSKASMGKQRLWGITSFCLVCFYVAYSLYFNGIMTMLFFILLPLSFLFTRLMYFLSCTFLRSLSLKSENLFNMLYGKAIFIKE